MTMPIEPRDLEAFVDGELDLKSRLAIERQLEGDAALCKQVDELRELRELVRAHADCHAAPEALRRRIATLMPESGERPAAHAPARGDGIDAAGAVNTIGAALRRWLGWRPLAASLALAAVLAVASNLLWLQVSKSERLKDDVVASHVRATLGLHLVDVASSDRHTVKPFLSSKLGYSPPVSELGVPGSAFLGGRIDYLDGRPVAALVYRQGEHIVDAFVWPSTASDSQPSFGAERGYLIAHWSRNGMAHWVISDVNRDEFHALVGAIAAAGIDR